MTDPFFLVLEPANAELDDDPRLVERKGFDEIIARGAVFDVGEGMLAVVGYFGAVGKTESSPNAIFVSILADESDEKDCK